MFKPKTTKESNDMVYKTLYINEELLNEVAFYAGKHDVSLNSMLIQMIKYCLEELKQQEE